MNTTYAFESPVRLAPPPDRMAAPVDVAMPHSAPDEMRAPVLSIIVPVYNEAAVINEFHRRTSRVLRGIPLPYEIVAIDDGSSDASAALLMALLATDPALRVVRLSRNFGKETAMSAGLDFARGSAVILIDADLQDPPELIPDMVRAWQSGADVVTMRRRSRTGEHFVKRACAWAYYRLLARMSATAIPADTGDFRLLSRRAVDIVRRFPERNRYMKGMFAWIGLPTREILYDRPIRAGRTKLPFPALLQLAVEGVTSYASPPTRGLYLMGVVAMTAGFACGTWGILERDVAATAWPMAALGLLSGIQLIALALLGEYVGRIYTEAKSRPLYIVQDVHEHSGAARAPKTDTFSE